MDVFVQARGGAEGDVRIVVEAVQLRDNAGNLHDLQPSLAELSSAELTSRRALAGAIVPPATYEAVLLTLSEAALLADGFRRPLELLPGDGTQPPTPRVEEEDELPPALVYEIPVQLELRRHEAASIFLDWDVETSLTSGDGLRPRFGASLEKPHVRLGMLYVADAATGMVMAIERGSGQVLSTGKVGASPSAVDIARNRRELYVANAGDGSVSLLDLQRNMTEFTVPIRLGAGTSDIVIADEGRLVAACNPGLDTVSLVDPRNAVRVADIRVGRSPVRLAAVPSLRRVFVINRRSDAMSVIDLTSRSVIATVKVESTPSDIAMDRRERELYVGHEMSQNLLVVDAQSLLVTETIFVGANVTALLADRQRDRIYVARDHPPEVSIVDRRLAAVVRRVPVAGRIEALAQPIDGPLIYGAAPSQGGLVVLDVVLGREQPLLPCGTTPSHVVAVD
jgi:YVTN family beta-propeller protein